ncbi:MAG: hypothetical protein ACOC5K_01060 [Chloroflexota bacterium]
MPDGIDQDAAHAAFTDSIGQWLGASLKPDPPADYVAGLVRLFQERAGEQWAHIASLMLRGHTLRTAATRSGLTYQGAQKAIKADPELSSLVAAAEAAGAGVFEGELMERALAGSEDKGSMRALELVVKARMPEYRDKRQEEITVTHKAESAMASVIDGWHGQP